MLPAMILLVAAYVPGEIKRRLKHPMLVAIKTWAVAHLLANGDLGSILLFGSFLVWAVVDRIAVKRRVEPSGLQIPNGGLRNDAIAVIVGLVLYGVGCAMTVEAGLGVDPWTVLAEGISIHTGIGIGWVANILGFFVLLLWIPLHQKPGIGTIANILLVGTSMQFVLWIFPPVSGPVAQFAVLIGGIVVVALASGLYIGAHFGPGPRDGLMTGMHKRLGWLAHRCHRRDAVHHRRAGEALSRRRIDPSGRTR